MADPMLKAYLKQATQIIGKRTSAEIAFDDAVVHELELGQPIRVALALAGKRHPAEALTWDADTIDDIAEHYTYLKEHARILRSLDRKPGT